MLPFAGFLSDEERVILQRSTSERQFRRNEVVFHEGDPADSLHFVQRGLFVARSASTLGHMLSVNTFRPGTVFGELSLVGADPVRSATVAALRTGTTRMLRRPMLETLRQGPVGRAIDQYLLVLLAERNRALTATVVELLFTPTWRRVQRQLLRLDELAMDDDGWIALSQDELAMLTATTRATVNRVLRDLVERGIVEVGRGRSRVIDRAALARMAA